MITAYNTIKENNNFVMLMMFLSSIQKTKQRKQKETEQSKMYKIVPEFTLGFITHTLQLTAQNETGFEYRNLRMFDHNVFSEYI